MKSVPTTASAAVLVILNKSDIAAGGYSYLTNGNNKY